MSDREKAISILSELRSGYSCFDSERPYYHALSEGIKALSQPERKTGRWIKENIVLTSYPPQYQWHCSQCGQAVHGFTADVLTDYCPNCGCKMEV